MIYDGGPRGLHAFLTSRRPTDAGPLDWMLDELSFVWREAHELATLAYEEWRRNPGAGAFAVYRAFQDQADAAEDELASVAAR